MSLYYSTKTATDRNWFCSDPYFGNEALDESNRVLVARKPSTIVLACPSSRPVHTEVFSRSVLGRPVQWIPFFVAGWRQGGQKSGTLTCQFTKRWSRWCSFCFAGSRMQGYSEPLFEAHGSIVSAFLSQIYGNSVKNTKEALCRSCVFAGRAVKQFWSVTTGLERQWFESLRHSKSVWMSERNISHLCPRSKICHLITIIWIEMQHLNPIIHLHSRI